MKEKRIAIYEYSIGLRWTHWLRFFAIVGLTITGFYLAYVFVAPEVTNKPVNFMNAKFRMWHEIFGFALIAVTIFKTYLFVLDRKSYKERVAIIDLINPIVWFKQIRYYLFLGDHPKLKGSYNPLQFIAYILLYGMLFLVSITGLVLYVHVYHQGMGALLYDTMRSVEVWMGGLANVREIHHICMWGILLFVPIHIYMAVFNSIKGKEGALGAIFSGYKFSKESHSAE